ncbi:SCO1/SenC family protein [Azoarcus sp. CIB]|uniref:SCO family protein n=1 Tax=Aromatoleum sp. (strain CIB) TaxID=198107 RepID=UPI00067CF336|nr:SCO family protein [Azoarcus sp. CIB]AKU13594.1 SCO1/SenC family protein [Azoarcus sp. CIB]
MLRALIVAATLAVATLAACSNPSATTTFRATDITGADYGKGLALSDHNGTPRTLADFRGKVVMLFFGYTQCPDVCPTNLATMAEVMRQLGPDAERLQVLFVTVDPERDTQQLLAQYVPVFDPRFIALRGDAAQTTAVAKEFRVFFQKSGDTSGNNYTVDHSTGTYVFDPAGRVRLYVKHGETADNIVADIRSLLAKK